MPIFINILICPVHCNAKGICHTKIWKYVRYRTSVVLTLGSISRRRSLVSGLGTLPKKNGCTCERQTMSVTSIHHLIHAALLVAGNVIWLQPTALNICIFAVLFFWNFAFPVYCFTLLLQKTAVCMNAVFCGRGCFLSRAAPFDCGLANWSCMSTSVKDDMLVCVV